MARVTYVKKAQQRYATKPVLNADGTQKQTPIMRNGVQRTNKRGVPSFLRVTESDKTKPLEPLSCDFHGCQIHGGKILPGDAYKHITPKSGPYGGWQRSRHAEHPSWQVWEYSNSLSARIAQIQDGFTLDGLESEDDVTDALLNMAEEIRSLAEEKREGAANIEDGFGHSTYQSEELEQVADDLDSWADDVEGAEVPSTEDFKCEECDGEHEIDCDVCGGTGRVEGETDEEGQEEDCEECEATGKVECTVCDASSDFDLERWQEAVQDISEPFDSPV